MKCREVQHRFAELIDGTVPEHDRRFLDGHIATCAACRHDLAEMKLFLADIKNDRPWEPPPDYWNTLLPRINARIYRKNASNASPVDVILVWLRRLAVPAGAALAVLLIITFTPDPAGTEDIAAVVRQLPQDELVQMADEQAEENVFDASESTVHQNELFSADDREEMAQLIHEEGTVLPGVETFGTSIAANDDAFDSIVPALEVKSPAHQ